ncbi:MAG: acetyl-CoA carboxylase biotin carboxylase subunit [candidate division Zixibacteria bacterium]|nr:acetyl-CoA carboxylase biotin carboxylase subunit [candidate division Zixibacteria bacterium]
MFKKILIANRGEIAIRIAKACHQLGIPTVGVYSEPDRKGKHIQFTDEAYLIGPAAPTESYLNIDMIVQTAKDAGCDAVHPGYGFLAENAAFAGRCEKEGLTFIGPKAETISLLGSKIEARRLVQDAGAPVIPGAEFGEDDFESCRKSAKLIGYPVLIKASAGGGGKGMRVVEKEEDLEEAVESASREARSAFGDGTVYIEKYLKKPRHVEIQILADSTGDCVYLFERECSIQRRHQKIIEETPSPALDPELRQRMGTAAVKIAQAAKYVNAGTVEFLLDEDKNFYFLEVNTRIQVEHPITEMVTGVDLVARQIEIADGNKLPFKQEELTQRGHSVECRIYAEDPENNFFPASGKILLCAEPEGPGIRNDSGIYNGYEVTVHYDPILSKLVTFGENREQALDRMAIALREYVVLGIRNNIRFLYDVINHEEFRKGNTDTGFLERHFPEYTAPDGNSSRLEIAIAAAMHHESRKTTRTGSTVTATEQPTPWQTLGAFRML